MRTGESKILIFEGNSQKIKSEVYWVQKAVLYT